MTHDLAAYHAHLSQSQYYIANGTSPHAVTWRYSRMGHVLVEKTSKNNTLISVVGHVVEHCLNCRPTGNYVTGEFSSLKKAKFQLQLMKPNGTPFAKDFDASLNALKNLQNQAASTSDRCNLIVTDGKNENICFTKDIFEKRVRLLFDVLPYTLTISSLTAFPVLTQTMTTALFPLCGLVQRLFPLKTLTDMSVHNSKGDIKAFRPTITVSVPAISETICKGILVEVHRAAARS
ncbi:hypothetical protein EI94DRAFT_1806660 [Lactarius quietus]|nr:hypothetical protein EI94DRAFT_1806660 [Lactarius quietus]